MMYLRPGNLEKDFIVKRKKTDISDTGTPYSGYVDTGLLVSGVKPFKNFMSLRMLIRTRVTGRNIYGIRISTLLRIRL